MVRVPTVQSSSPEQHSSTRRPVGVIARGCYICTSRVCAVNVEVFDRRTVESQKVGLCAACFDSLRGFFAAARQRCQMAAEMEAA